MKKLTIFIFFCIILLVPVILSADTTVEYKSENWEILLFKDDFTDKISCCLSTKNLLKHSKPGISIFAKHHTSPKHILLFANGNIEGIGITYRVDKNPPVTFGYKYHFQTKMDCYFLKGSEYDKLVNDFKTGSSVIYQVHSGNQFITGAKEKISLIGFTKTYDMAKKCTFK